MGCGMVDAPRTQTIVCNNKELIAMLFQHGHQILKSTLKGTVRRDVRGVSSGIN
jgi:hypothetical protein